LYQPIGAAVPARMTRRSSKRRIKHAFHPDTAGINPAARWVDSRSGFTLVEIMMVVTIIAILMTLTVKVVGAFLDQARSTATQSTLSKIQSLMNSRRQAFDRLTQRKGFFTTTPEYVFAQANYSTAAAKPVASKLLQMKYFPQSANDLNFLMFQVYVGNPTAQLQFANMYPKLFQPFVQPAPSAISSFVAPLVATNSLGNPPTNQEILYNILTENVLGDSPLGTDSFSATEVVTEPPISTPVTNGLPYFIDAWKGPIKFYRWPTRLFRSGGTGIAISPNDVLNAKLVFAALPVFTGNLQTDLARDPDDPLQSCTAIVNFESLYVNAAFHTPATFHMPLIVSAGPDGILGMAQPDALDDTSVTPPVLGRLASVISQDALTDNLVSASIKAGGK
jgi:prepilin-type N-terminal cleavage/methylation domain-containing protein